MSRADGQDNRGDRAQWDHKAEFWDQLHGDAGNEFHRTLVEPAVARLLAPQPGERIVDAACGNGTLARWLSDLGAEVSAFDFSRELLALAERRDEPRARRVDYHLVDAADEDAVAALGEGQFDAAVCTMALMDMSTITALYRGLIRLLRPGGRFVFVTGHPVFDTANPVRITEVSDDDGVLSSRRAVRLDRYLDVPATRAVGARGEPTPHDLHHRPLHALLADAFAAGFVLDALDERGFPADADPFWQFPRILAGRLRKLGNPR